MVTILFVLFDCKFSISTQLQFKTNVNSHLQAARDFFSSSFLFFYLFLKMRKDDAIVWQLTTVAHTITIHTCATPCAIAMAIQQTMGPKNSTTKTINKIKVNNDGKSTSRRQREMWDARASNNPAIKISIESNRATSSTQCQQCFAHRQEQRAIFILYHLRTLTASVAMFVRLLLLLLLKFKYMSIEQVHLHLHFRLFIAFYLFYFIFVHSLAVWLLDGSLYVLCILCD